MIRNYSLMAALWGQNRTRIMTIAILLLLIVTVYAIQNWTVEPKLTALRTEQSRLQQDVRQRQMKFAASGVPVSTAEQIEKNLQQFEQLIPVQTDFSTFLGELFDWSNQAGLEIHQIAYQPEYEDVTRYLRYGLSFSVKGSYAQVKKFIHLLEHAERILMVEKISLVGSATKKSSHNVNLRIELATYFQGEAT